MSQPTPGRDTDWKRRLARGLHRIERRLDALIARFRPPRPKEPLIDGYLGYSEPDALVLRGRILTALRRSSPRADQKWWVNLAQMISLFVTDEVAGVEVRAKGCRAVSDEEGYFTLRVAREDGLRGWTEVPVTLGDSPQVAAALAVQVTPEGAQRGVISDIDDTVMRTGAYSLIRNLWTSMTGNALTREIFTDAIDLIETLCGKDDPVFYVSSSPWNLHDFLNSVFARNGLRRGPMFLRDLGISNTQLVTNTHGAHKGSAIDRILEANPDLPFVLVGDTGQHDAQVYRDAVLRHPGRIERVILRAPGPGADASDLAYAEELRKIGVPVEVDADFHAALETLA